MQGPVPVRAVEEHRGMWVCVVCVSGGGGAEDQHMEKHGGGGGGGGV